MAILISMFSVVITGFNTNWDFVKKNAESFRELVVGVNIAHFPFYLLKSF